MRIILNNYLAKSSVYRGKGPLTKPVSTSYNGSMMRNLKMRENLPNENHYHLDFTSKLNNEICEVSI